VSNKKTAGRFTGSWFELKTDTAGFKLRLNLSHNALESDVKRVPERIYREARTGMRERPAKQATRTA
jgi:hypothetical protein